MQGFIDRRSEALRALDDLLDRLGDDDDDTGYGTDTEDSSVKPSRGSAHNEFAVTDDDCSQHHHGVDDPIINRSGTRIPRDDTTWVLDLLSAAAEDQVINGQWKCPHDEDPLADLPLPSPVPGYRRADDGTWRYAHGGIVPGARDDNLGRRYRFAARPGSTVLIPVELCRRDDLLWVREHHSGNPAAATRLYGRSVPAYEIRRGCWNDRARITLGLTAPELVPTAMLDLAGLARKLGVLESTVTAYKARGRLPDPQYTVANSPLWSVPIIDQWLLTRGIVSPAHRRSKRSAAHRTGAREYS